MTGNLTIIFKRKFEEVLPITFMISAFILYLFAFISHITLGVYIILGISLIFPLNFIIKWIVEKKCPVTKNNNCQDGIIMFVILAFFIFIINYQKGFSSWDEYSHWGPMVKEILRLDTFYSVPESKLAAHKDYPPAITLIEVLGIKLNELAGFSYSENILYMMLQMFMLSCYLPFFSRCKIGIKYYTKIIKSLYIIGIVVLIQLFISLAEAQIYLSIYTDGAMAAVLVYIFYLIIVSEKFDVAYWIQLSISLAFLLLTKQMGIAFYLLAIGTLYCRFILERKKITITKRMVINLFGYTLVIPGLIKKSWDVYISFWGIHGQFSLDKLELKQIPLIIIGKSDVEYRNNVFEKFIDYLMHYKLNCNPIKISYLFALFLFFIIAMLFILILFKKGKKQRYMLANIMLFLGGGAYAFAMLVMYLFLFSKYEANKLACYDRYMGTYLFAYFIIMALIIISIECEQHENNMLFMLLSIVTCVFLLLPNNVINQIKPVIEKDSNTKDLEQEADIIIQNTPEDSKIFFISQQDYGWNNYRMSYLTLPRKYNKNSYSLGKPYYEGDIWTKDINSDDIVDIWKEYQYMYFYHIDEQFIERYGFLFGSIDELQDGNFYKIMNEKDEIKFIRLN